MPDLKSIPSIYISLITGLTSSLIYLYLAFNSQEYGQTSLSQMLSVYFSCTILCALVYWHHYLNKNQISIPLLLGFALIFRIIGFFTFPVLEDDFYRYLWDGHQTITNNNPYLLAPAHFFDSDTISDQFEEILNGINYPFVATVYGPTSQWFFAAAAMISPGEIWPLKLILLSADIAIIVILLKLTKPNAVLLYAWCPLILKEFVVTTHPDLLGAFFLIWAMHSYLKQRFIMVGILMALACGIKIFPVILLPFLLKFFWRGWLSFVITVIIIAIPFGLQTAWFPEGLQVMSGDWFFNAPLYVAFYEFLPASYSIFIFKLIIVGVFGLLCATFLLSDLNSYYFKQQPLQLPRGDILFAAMLICLPALNPWYAIWLLVFLSLKPNIFAWLATMMLLLSYSSGINLSNNNLGSYQIPNWVLAIEFGSMLLLLTVCFLYKKYSSTRQI